MRFSRLALAAAGLLGFAHAEPADTTPKKVLVIAEFDSSAENTYLRSLPDKYTVTGVTKAQFQAMEIPDFGAYNAIVIADLGTCDPNDISFLDSATTLKLATVASGVHIFTGTSLTKEVQYRKAHSRTDTDVYQLFESGMNILFQANSQSLYISLSCYYQPESGSGTYVQFLSNFGDFQMRSASTSPPDCSSNVKYGDKGAQVFPGTTEADLQAWGCAALSVFYIYPGNYVNFIQDQDIIDQSTLAVGKPYILGRKPSAESTCGNGRVDSAFNEQCEPQSSTDPICTQECQCKFGLNTDTNTCLPFAGCGNNFIEKDQTNGEPDEECDDGLTGSSTCTTECKCKFALDSTTGKCKAPGCGNGVFEAATEECDAGPNGSDLCSDTCKCKFGRDGDGTAGFCKRAPFCGNFEVEEGEECEPKSQQNTGRRGLDGRAYDPAVSDGICSDKCLCIYGLSAAPGVCNPIPVCGNGEQEVGEECEGSSDLCKDCKCVYGRNEDGSCKAADESTTTSATTTTNTLTTTSRPVTSTPATSRPASSSPTSKPSSVPTSSPTSSGAPVQTNDPLPARLSSFVFKACTGSTQNYPSFSFMFSSDDMDLEMCLSGCAGRQYAGIHVRDCYCSDQYDAVQMVAKDLCSVPCPGNPLENCGGYRANSTSTLQRRDSTCGGVKRRQAGAGPVPANALLAIYEFSPLSTTAPVPVPATPIPVDQVTTTATAIVTAMATVTAGPNPNAPASGCATGFCHAGGYIFELCEGGPRPGEAVFVIQACSCAGGWRWAPAGCDGTSCGSLVVYRAVPYTGDDNGTVYQAQTCTSCAGGVSFEKTVVTNTTVVTGTVPANGTGIVVVVAGASKLAGYLSSAMVAVGAFVLLL